MTRELGRDEVNAEDFDPKSADFLYDPYPYYQWFRRYSPVTPVYHEYNAFWVFRHEDIENVLNDPDPDLWSKRDPKPSKTPPLLPNSLFLSDPSDDPSHGHLRQILEPVLRNAMEDVGEFAQQRARKLVESLSEQEEFDLIKDFATPLPSSALAHVLGIPARIWDTLVEPLVGKVVIANDPTISFFEDAKGKGSMLAMRKAYKKIIEKALAASDSGLEADFDRTRVIAAMYELASSEYSGFTAGDFEANATSITLAGFFSTSFVLGTGIANLINNPSLQEQIKAKLETEESEAVLRGLAGEMLRHNTPIQIIDRYATKRTSLGGKTINEGDKVGLVIGSGNRDEDVFSNPDVFDPNRDTSSKLSFGSGIHRCLGAPMFARVAPAAIGAILDELPNLTIGDNSVKQVDPYFSGYNSLTLRYNS